ncbi:MAG: DUF4920 domain-containing protein [Desulfobacula sp.]|jgi:hypothetical protein|nr:DUF4920 domain-containing protein [Desulfobacula sp.]
MFRFNKVLLILAVLAITHTYAYASNSENFGKPITLQEITKVSDILASPENYANKKVLVKGMVVEVCAKRGCWMDIASDKAFEKIQIKVLDGVIVFPLSARGKEALVEGKVEALNYTKEEAIELLEHKAEEKGEKFDPSSVTGPLTTYRIKALGATITE